MQEQEFELSVGDVVQIGDYLVTVIDFDGPEVSFRVDPVGSEELAVDDMQSSACPRK